MSEPPPEPTLLVMGGEPRKRGRSLLSGTSEPSSVVGFRIPVSQHDQLIRVAGQKRMEVSEYLRELVTLTLPANR